MATYESLLAAQDIAFDLNNKLKALFPDSFVAARASNSLGGGFHVTLHFALGLDSSEWQNGIIQNDPAYMILFVYEGSVDVVQVSYIMRKANVPIIRQKKCAPEEGVKHIAKYFEKNKDAILALKGRTY